MVNCQLSIINCQLKLLTLQQICVLCKLLTAKVILFLYCMTKLSVNINKVATLRNARGGNNPDVCRFALDCEAMGAEGITVEEAGAMTGTEYGRASSLISLLELEGFISMDLLQRCSIISGKKR